MTSQLPVLLVIMPVYNEQESVLKVITEWFPEIDRVVSEFVMLVIDDGSSDSTLGILNNLKTQLGARLEIMSRNNRGHGQTCIQGYHIALERRIPYVFQIDSDGQCDPQYFHHFWEQRDQFDVIYGKRSRQDGLRRILASFTLRCALRLLAKADCVDANVPYRLMNTEVCGEAIRRIPPEINLANIALAVCLKRDRMVRHGHTPIGFPPRHGGEPSVPFSKFAAKAIELFRQLKAMERLESQVD